jgi:hypothetical protein
LGPEAEEMTFATHPERQFLEYLRGRGWVKGTTFSKGQFPGKLSCRNAPFPDSKSMTWEFFTDDKIEKRSVTKLCIAWALVTTLSLFSDLCLIRAWDGQ